ncbi:unnamed protein product [Dovyalis caffra]|uniref:Fe2OG dioxygenase domain-containing protein n=1 Tax=Dovyalis caffra TaxID=77055 RepID=A0AAV1RW81_9ROSI|nr:unnamed protein product [Dovyalis caffra]
MEKLISSRRNLKSVPESYILPPEIRPGNTVFPLCNIIPVIDLGGDHLACDGAKITDELVKASQEFGFFQLINHGVSENLMQDVLKVANEFFQLPADDKDRFYSEDPRQSCRLYTSIDYVQEKVHYWRDNLRHPCHPLQEHVQFWPEKPTQYREVIGKYSIEVRRISLFLLDLICKGLGLESGYFENELSQVQSMTINHYPPCPDPSLTLGLPKHSDVGLLTILLQGDIPGLQVLKDGQWLAVEPLPNAFVVNIGHVLQIISNGRLKSAEHRVVTNPKVARTTVGSFILPSPDSYIESAKALTNNCYPQLYRTFVYKDFLHAYIADTSNGIPPLERYKLQH